MKNLLHPVLIRPTGDPTAAAAILEVLPVGTAFSRVELPTEVAGAGSDFEALEKLRRLAFAGQVEAPKQLDLWKETSPL